MYNNNLVTLIPIADELLIER